MNFLPVGIFFFFTSSMFWYKVSISAYITWHWYDLYFVIESIHLFLQKGSHICLDPKLLAWTSLLYKSPYARFKINDSLFTAFSLGSGTSQSLADFIVYKLFRAITSHNQVLACLYQNIKGIRVERNINWPNSWMVFRSLY